MIRSTSTKMTAREREAQRLRLSAYARLAGVDPTDPVTFYRWAAQRNAQRAGTTPRLARAA